MCLTKTNTDEIKTEISTSAERVAHRDCNFRFILDGQLRVIV